MDGHDDGGRRALHERAPLRDGRSNRAGSGWPPRTCIPIPRDKNNIHPSQQTIARRAAPSRPTRQSRRPGLSTNAPGLLRPLQRARNDSGGWSREARPRSSRVRKWLCASFLNPSPTKVGAHAGDRESEPPGAPIYPPQAWVPTYVGKVLWGAGRPDHASAASGNGFAPPFLTLPPRRWGPMPEIANP